MYLKSLKPEESESMPLVIGAVEDHGQLRRTFNEYIQETRAHPGRTFLYAAITNDFFAPFFKMAPKIVMSFAFRHPTFQVLGAKRVSNPEYKKV